MPQVGEWNGHRFEVSGTVIRPFDSLNIKGAVDTEDQKNATDSYAKVKNAKPVEIKMTVYLNARLGCDVRKETMSFVQEASVGKTAYLYIGGEKVIAGKMMLVTAEMSDVKVTPKGKWMSSEIKLTFKQGEGGNQSGGGGGNGGGSGTVDKLKAATENTKAEAKARLDYFKTGKNDEEYTADKVKTAVDETRNTTQTMYGNAGKKNLTQIMKH